MRLLAATALALFVVASQTPQALAQEPIKEPNKVEREDGSSQLSIKNIRKMIDKSVNRYRRAKLFGKQQSTRVSVTHEIAAPVPSAGGKTESEIFIELRRQLYVDVRDECTLLAELFQKSCHFQGLNIRPQRSYNKIVNTVKISGTATYLLSEKSTNE